MNGRMYDMDCQDGVCEKYNAIGGMVVHVALEIDVGQALHIRSICEISVSLRFTLAVFSASTFAMMS
jgi:hypothetical protein